MCLLFLCLLVLLTSPVVTISQCYQVSATDEQKGLRQSMSGLAGIVNAWEDILGDAAPTEEGRGSVGTISPISGVDLMGEACCT